MGDISELRGLIVVVTFLGVFVLLIAWIPAELFEAGEARNVEVPSIFETVDMYSYADTGTLILNETGGINPPLDPSWYIEYVDDGDGEAPKDIGGHEVRIWYKDANETQHLTKHEHMWHTWIFYFGHWQTYYDRNGVNMGEVLNVTDIEDNSLDNETSVFQVKCQDFSLRVIYGYNATTYSNFTDAWDHHGLHVFHAINFDQVGTSYNAFDLIAKLLFFQLPETHFYINALLAIPLWVTIAYLIYVLIIKVIPFIAGG